MPKVAVLNDVIEVMTSLTSVEFEALINFGPELIVVVIDEGRCLITDPGATEARPGSMDLLRPHAGETSDQEEARAKGRGEEAG